MASRARTHRGGGGGGGGGGVPFLRALLGLLWDDAGGEVPRFGAVEAPPPRVDVFIVIVIIFLRPIFPFVLLAESRERRG
jgi:hypothetical protein